MERLQAYKFQLRPKAKQEAQMRRFAGCCRFLWNKALAFEKETYEVTGKRLGFAALCKELHDWKRAEVTAFLAEAHSQILQQALKDLDRAYVNFFQKRAELPRFKKKGVHDSFRYPQGFRLDEGNSRIYLPKIGWMRYRKSRDTEGMPKQITVSLAAGKWYVAIQTEREVETPVHPSQSAVGIDMGIACFAAISDGTMLNPLNSFRKQEKKLAATQRKLALKTKFSANWHKQKAKVSKLHKKIANVRNDFLHKATTSIGKNHALVVMEDLKVKNMSRSASGSLENPGCHVRAKSGLNKSILDQGWFEFRRQLDYKLAWSGGTLLVVPPQYTSQTCHVCGNVDKANRLSQAYFVCSACGHVDNADHNASLNILAAGQAVSACGAGKAQAPVLKQEPAYGASVRTLPIGIPSL
ncbi:MAG: transposase [Desulfovibrio sp.]|jgi:putative transposase|nr:transposase [Desulfovibrio sp.]